MHYSPGGARHLAEVAGLLSEHHKKANKYLTLRQINSPCTSINFKTASYATDLKI
jgi:hypothetical protein